MKRFILFFIIFSAYGFLNSQKITIEGQYNGENLYVLNSSGGVGGFCVTGVNVNGNKTNDAINSSSFEIDLSQLNLNIGQALTIEIFHKANCIPDVINPDAIRYQNNFTFKMIDANRKGMLTWVIVGNPGNDNFIVQQYRWDKWVNVAEVKVADSVSFGKYSYEIYPHFGQNLLRVIQTDKFGNTVYSDEEKYRTIVKEIFLESAKVNDELEFTAETMYEIYNSDGELLKSGVDSDVDLSGLEQGEYWVNYDNKTEKFIKK